MNTFKIALGADHGGYHLKNIIREHLEHRGIACEDFGTNSSESVDYPEYAKKVCHAITSGKCTRGILVCGTGIGMSIAANKHKGIRAACCMDTFSARMTRHHNDANILCLGERVIGIGLALDLVDAFLDTQYDGGRHEMRLAMIRKIEEEQ